MRAFAATMCVFLVAVSVLGQQPPAAQQPALPPEGPQRDQWLEAVLKNWETAMARVTTLEAECERVTDIPAFKTKDVYRGKARYVKGDGPGTSRASLHLVNKENPKVTEQMILTGAFVYEVAPAAKEIRVYTVPQPKAGENVDHNLVGLLFGMKAEQAKQRFKVDLVHADANYFYLQVIPKTDQDKNDFSKAQLALLRTTYLPRQLHFFQVNGTKVSWDLPTIQTPANHLTPRDFQAPEVPQGWKMNRVPVAGAGPSKIRSSGNP